MAIDVSGEWWTGTEPTDIADFLEEYTERDHPVTRVVPAVCRSCESREFSLRVNTFEGVVQRTCAHCDESAWMLDSAVDGEQYAEQTEVEDLTCSCGGADFNVAVGFSLYADGEMIRRVYFGVRCVVDGILGCCAEWRIGYSPCAHLFDQV